MERGTWFYSHNGTSHEGPVGTERLQGMLREGALAQGALIWRPGFAEWRGVETAAGLVFLDAQSAPLQTDVAPPPLPALRGAALTGIGGWLLVPAVGLVIAPIRMAVDIVQAFGLLGEYLREGPAAIATTDGAFIIGVILVEIPLIAFQAWVATLFFRKKRLLPNAMTALIITRVAWAIIPLVAADMIAGDDGVGAPGYVAAALIMAAIWIPYFRTSRRVKNTFVVP